MAYITGNRSNTISLGQRIAEIAAQFSEGYQAWRLYRRTLSELQGLSMRDLNDLGLNQTTLHRAALDAAYGKRA